MGVKELYEQVLKGLDFSFYLPSTRNRHYANLNLPYKYALTGRGHKHSINEYLHEICHAALVDKHGAANAMFDVRCIQKYSNNLCEGSLYSEYGSSILYYTIPGISAKFLRRFQGVAQEFQVCVRHLALAKTFLTKSHQDEVIDIFDTACRLEMGPSKSVSREYLTDLLKSQASHHTPESIREELRRVCPI